MRALLARLGCGAAAGPRGALLAGLLLGSLALASPAAATPGDPTLEQWRQYQDRLLEAGEKGRLLSEFRDRAAAEESALNRYLLGRACGMLQDLEKARPEFERALEIDPLFGPACYGLALCLLPRGEVDHAIEVLRRAVRIDPGDDRALVLLAGLLADQDRQDEAERILKGLLERKPGDVEARFLLARMYLRSRRVESARDELKTVLFHDKSHLPARKALAFCYTMLQSWPAAEAELRLVLEATPEDFETNLILAEVLLRTHQTKEARTLLQGLLLRKPPADLEARLRAALEAIDRDEQGLADVRSIQEIVKRLADPDVRVRREAMRTLSRFAFARLPREVLQCVRDEDVEVRVRVVRLIGATEDEGNVPILTLLLRHPVEHDSSPLVRGACVEALAAIPSPSSLAVLLTVLDDTDPYVLELTVKALRTLAGVRFSERSPAEAAKSPDEARKAWWGWWRSGEASVRKQKAVEAIARIRSRVLVPYLVPLLGDADKEIFRQAHAALTAITGKSFGEVEDDPAARARVAKEALEWWKAGGK